MGAYIHYGLICSILTYRTPDLSEDENLTKAKTFIGKSFDIEHLDFQSQKIGVEFRPCNTMFKQNMRDLLQKFHTLYQSCDTARWEDIMAQNWEEMGWPEINNWLNNPSSESFWDEGFNISIQKTRVYTKVLCFESEGKVNFEDLTHTLDLLNSLMQKELAPNPLAPFFFVWVS
jgi:hypothetical protein